MRVIHIERAEGVVPGLYDVEFDNGRWAMDLTVGQVRQLAPDVPTERFTWWRSEGVGPEGDVRG